MIVTGCDHPLGELQRLERAADAVFPADRLPDAEPASVDVLQRAIEQRLLWCAESHEVLCGFAFAEIHDTWLHLQQVAVHPDASRRGFGSSLVCKVMEVARERALSGVDLTTFSDFPWNAPFYRSLGFVECRSPTGYLAQRLEQQQRNGMSNRIAMVWRVQRSGDSLRQ